MTKVDYLIVGSGFTGATIARILTDAGRDVLVLERRSEIGGNVHDQVHKLSGIRYNTWGPHYFRTNAQHIWDFVNRFATWVPYSAVVQTWLNGELHPWPPRIRARNVVGPEPTNFEEYCLSVVPKYEYVSYIKPYTEKQWGVHAKQLDVSLARRVVALMRPEGSTDLRLSQHQFQGLPVNGYTTMMEEMLKGIKVEYTDFLQHRGNYHCKKLIYTGPVDEYYNYDLGKLKYRGQIRAHRHYPMQEYQPVAQCNEPSPTLARIRTIEWKHLPNQPNGINGTLVTTETPYTPDDPNHYEYPFPSNSERELYNEYKKRVPDNVIMCGRLGSFRYLDMDQAIGQSISIAQKLILGIKE